MLLASSAQAAGSADLRVAQSINPPQPQVGQDVSYQVLIANRGPDTATNVRVVDTLPEGATVTSMPSFCSRSGATIVCTPGSIPANGAGSVLVVLRPSFSGPFSNRTQVSSAETDPVPTDNDTTTTITVSETPPPGIDPPQFTERVDAKPAGTVLARPPGAPSFTPVTRPASYPVGTVFDARHGSVRIYSQLQTG